MHRCNTIVARREHGVNGFVDFLTRDAAWIIVWSGRRSGHAGSADLAAQLGVRCNPVREALTRLEQQGLAVVVPNQGAYVVNPTRAQVRDALVVRVYPEILALRQAMTNPDPHTFAPLRRVVGELQAGARANGMRVVPACWDSMQISVHRPPSRPNTI